MSTVILSSQKHFRMRAYEEEDLQAIANFLNTCETVDQYGQFCTVSELQAEFTEPGFEPTQNVRLWLDDTGQIIAFAQLWIPQQTEISLEAEGYLGFRVHPQFRDQGLEAEVLGWAETRVTEMAQGRALPARLRATCRDYEQSRLQLFGQFDLHHERSFLRMTRNLTGPLPEARLPEGFVIAHGLGAEDLAARVELCNQSFVDHWNYHPATVEEWAHWESLPTHQPELAFVAIAPDGTYASFCHGHIEHEDNAQRGCQEGHIVLLGTHRNFRRQGLGRALLVTGMMQLQQAGITLAKLSVDAENPNQAQGLYESVGFRKHFAHLVHTKQLPTAPLRSV